MQCTMFTSCCTRIFTFLAWACCNSFDFSVANFGSVFFFFALTAAVVSRQVEDDSFADSPVSWFALLLPSSLDDWDHVLV